MVLMLQIGVLIIQLGSFLCISVPGENDEDEKVELDVNLEKLLPNIPSAVFDMQDRFRESTEVFSLILY